MRTQIWFILRWICGTIFGLMLGVGAGVLGIPILLGLVFALSANETLVWIIGIPTALMIPLIVGAFVGLGQWQLALQKYIPKRVWLGTNAVVGVTFVIGIIISNFITPDIITESTSGCSGMCMTFEIASTWLVSSLTIGICIGLAIGIPQSIVLRHYRQNTDLWIFDNTIASILAIIIYVLILKTFNNLLTYFSGICLAPIIYAFITGFPLYNMLARKPKPKHDDARIVDDV